MPADERNPGIDDHRVTVLGPSGYETGFIPFGRHFQLCRFMGSWLQHLQLLMREMKNLSCSG
jgi:hypothetical protein